MIPPNAQAPDTLEQEPPVQAPWRTRVKRKLAFLGQLAVLTVIYLIGNQVVSFTGLPIPGNVVGVVLLYALLNLGLLRLDHVQDAADFLLRHLVFFFIPVAVDLMNWGSLFWNYGLMLALAIVASTVATYLGTGRLAQWLRSREESCPNS
jgi:holin-like protein